MNNLQEYKIDSLNKKSQFVTFDDDGFVVDSCNTLIDLSEYKTSSLFNAFPIVENFKPQFDELEIGEAPILIPRIENNFNNKTNFHDYEFSRVNIGNDKLVLWVIYDFTEHYKYLISMQQERNEAIVKNEYLVLENELNQLDKNINNLKIENLFKTAVFNNINDKIIAPIITCAQNLKQLATEHNSSQHQEKLLNIYNSINNIIYKINLNNIFALNKKEQAEVSKSTFNLSEALWCVTKLFQDKLSTNKKCKILFKLGSNTPKQIVSNKQYIIKTLCNLLNEINIVFVKDEVEIDVLQPSNSEVVKFCIKRTDFALNNQLIRELSDLNNNEGYVKQIDLSTVTHLLKQIKGNIKCNLKDEDKYLIEVEIPYMLAA